MVVRWERLWPQNHSFDALYDASCAVHLAGVPVEEVEAPPPPPVRRDDLVSTE